MDPYQDIVAAIVRDAMDKIQEYRRLRGLSGYALAAKAVIARQSVGNLENGATKRPAFAMVMRLWLALEIPPEFLTVIVQRHALPRASRVLD